MKKKLVRIAAILCLLLLLINPNLSIAGAKSGLLLWFQTVIPTLLPFMICSNIILRLDAAHYLTFAVNGILNKLLSLSKKGVYALVIGLLCGYPMGAKTCADLVSDGKIDRREGQFLLAFCNHASPMFIIGFLVNSLAATAYKSPMLLALYLPIIPLALLSKYYYQISDEPELQLTKAEISPEIKQKNIVDDSIMNAFEVILKVGGYIILFSILAAYLNTIQWKLLPGKLLLLGTIEITTGIQAIGMTYPSSELGCLLAVVITAFGGLSGLAQTKSVIKNTGLSIRHYLFWKFLHGIFSGVLFMLLIHLL